MDDKLFVKYVTSKVFHSCLIMSSKTHELERENLTKTYDILNDTFEKYKRRVLPNNKLKLMGIPMRRKGG